jgi:hypothetical protein
MTQKAFLDKYSGQTLTELLALTDTYREDSIILAIEQALQSKAPADVAPSERVVLAVEAFEREVNNGGYSQFFLNEPTYARDIVAALTQIGCPEIARITRDAADVLGLRRDWTDEQIQAAAADMADDGDERLSELDDQFFEYPEPIEERLLTFVRANAAEIRL